MAKPEDRGAAAVEMAISLILLLWLVFGVIDLGRAIFTNISLQEAAQSAAAFGAFAENATRAEVKNVAITASGDSPALAASDVVIACTTVPRDSQDGSRIRVTVTHQLSLITPIVSQALGGALNLNKMVEADRFFPSCNDLQEVPW